MPAFRVRSEFEPAGDQPKAIAELAEGVKRGDRFQTLLGITGSGKSATIAWTVEQVQKPDAGPGAQQVAGCAAGQRVPRVLPRQPGRVLRLVLRLLPARGVPPQLRHLHREGRHDQRRDRPAPPLGHLGAAHPPRHDRRRVGVRHLRPRLARGVPEELPDPAGGGGARPAGHPRPAGRHAVRAQRHEPRPGQVPGPGRHDRGAPRLRRDDRAHRDVRRHDRVDHGGRPGHRRAAERADRAGRVPRHPLRRRRGADGPGDRAHRGRAAGTAGLLRAGGQAARGAAAPHAHPVRPGDDAGGRLLLGHRELLGAHRRSQRRARRPTR